MNEPWKPVTQFGASNSRGKELQYLAVKERYLGVEEDRQYLQMLQAQARAAAIIPGTQQARDYVPEHDIWTTNWLERNGIYAGRIHCVYGLDWPLLSG